MTTLTLFYTAHINGDLHMLPRLYTFIRQLAQQHDTKPLLLDLGDSCSPQVWPCDITGGRSTIIVLDGMGYHAVNSEGVLAQGERHTLHGAISTALVDARYSWRYDVPPHHDEGIVTSLEPTPALTLNIVLKPTTATTLELRVLQLADIAKGQVGMVEIDMQDEPRLQATDIATMPKGLRPDATISAAVEFVEDEARFLSRKS